MLAFEDMSPAKDQEYFCDGIAEESINDLAQVGGLRVASRTSSFAYKGRREDIRDIGRKLGVQSVLEGSVRRTDSHLRITTQLISVADGHHLWTEQYDRELEDVFAIQEEIAHRQYLEKDSDFDPIREHPSYKALIKDLKAREKESGST